MNGTPTISNLVVLLTANTSQFNAAMGKASGVTAKFGAAAKVGMGLAAVGVAALAAEAVDAASDQNEALNKSSVVFGESADAAERFANTSAESFGISKTAALEAASGFGAVLQTAGLTEQASADMSVALTQLGADMASFNNITVDDALLKLKSGLAGEAEPLRAVGVLLSEARVKQEAYASGIAATGAELTEGQKVQARYNLILQDTAKQQGDFERTSEGLANQQRILQAQFEDLSAELGQKLLPAAVSLLDVLSELLTLISGVDVRAAADETAELVQAWDAGTISVREFLTQVDELQDEYNMEIELSDELFSKLQRQAEGVDLVSRAHGSYFGPATAAAGATEDVGAAADEAADKLRGLRLAELALVDDTFALLDAQNQIKEAQRELNRLEDKGREGTKAYDEAVANVILTQGAYEQQVLEVAQAMQDADKDTRDIISTIRDLGEKGNLTKGQIQGIIDTLRDLDGMRVNASIGIALDTFRGSINRGFGDAASRLIAQTEPWMVPSAGMTVNVTVANAYGLDDLDRKVSESLSRSLRRRMSV